MNEIINEKQLKMKPITRVALGRVHPIGELYDAVEDQFTSSLAFTEDIKKYVSPIDCGGIEYSFISANSLGEKMTKLGLEDDLKASVVCGLVKVKGSGKYLTEHRKRENKISFSMVYKIKTKKQLLSIYNESLRSPESLPLEEIQNDIGTHIVTGINWGAMIVANFEFEAPEFKSKWDTEEEKREVIEYTENYLSKGGKNQSEKYKNKISVKVYSDISPMNCFPYDLESYYKFLLFLPDLIMTTNNGFGVPIEYILFPIQRLNKNPDALEYDLNLNIDKELLNQIIAIQETIEANFNSYENMIDKCSDHEEIFSTQIEKLEEEKTQFESGVIGYTYDLGISLIDVRTKKDSKNEGMPKVIEEYIASENHPDKYLRRVLDVKHYLEQKMNLYDYFTKQGCTILSPTEYEDYIFFDDETKNTFVLYTRPEYLKDDEVNTKYTHKYFFELKRVNPLAAFYVVDYQNDEELFKHHKSPLKPSIHSYYDNKLVVEDYSEEIKKYQESKQEEEES